MVHKSGSFKVYFVQIKVSWTALVGIKVGADSGFEVTDKGKEETGPAGEFVPEEEDDASKSAGTFTNSIQPNYNPYKASLNDDDARFYLRQKPRRPKDFVPLPDPEPVKLRIKKISRNGIMNIKFNQKLIRPHWLALEKMDEAKSNKKYKGNMY